MSVPRRAWLAVAALALGCGDGDRDVVVSQLGVAAESAACGCWNGAELSVVNGCTATITARIVDVDSGRPVASADGETVTVIVRTASATAGGGEEVMRAEAPIEGDAVRFGWHPELAGVEARTALEMFLTPSVNRNESIVPVTLLDVSPAAPAPHVLCAYWAWPGGAVVNPDDLVAAGTRVTLTARLAGNVAGAFAVWARVAEAEGAAAYDPVTLDPAADHLSATGDWDVPPGVSTVAFFFEAEVVLEGSPFDEATSAALRVQ